MIRAGVKNARWRTLLLVVIILLATSSAARTPQVANDGTVIEDVTLISPERAVPLRHATVVIRDGKIAVVGTRVVAGPHARRIDGRNRFLIPGLIDSHVHVGASAALDDDAIDAHPDLWAAYRAQVPPAYLAFGFTTVVDLDLKQSDQTWFTSTPLHPHLYSCGRGIKVAGGYGVFQVPPPGSPKFPNLVYEPQEDKSWPQSLNASDYTPERAVARAADAGAICVKAFVETGFGLFHWPYLHEETLHEIRRAATLRHLTLLVHANALESWQEALGAHADVIAHGLWIWPGDMTSAAPPKQVGDVIAAVAREQIHVQPTMQAVAGERAFYDTGLLDDPRLTMALPRSVIGYLRSPEGEKARKALLERYQKILPGRPFPSTLAVFIERTRATFNIMLRDQVPLVFGSDTPAADGFGNPPGLNGRLEMQNWADSGAPLSLLLRAATIDNASALGLAAEVGSIEVGKRADMVLLKENPLASVAAYDSIEAVFLDGQPIPRETLRGQQ
ncbi:MAG TPA: amidohydrolase family protein [Terriglobales bacterium]|nr:amidohydrolase family protein [Terriglobales bacterium]